MEDNSSVTILKNPLRGKGLPSDANLATGTISRDAAAATALFRHCPAAATTPLIDQAILAKTFGVAKLSLKDERSRMRLGSFKALGAAYAIAKQAAQQADPRDPSAMATALNGETFVCASAGNHGMSMAAGARLFGAKAVVYLSETVPTDFANRLREKDAEVIVEGSDYAASMAASKQAAIENGWILLSDGSWAGYSRPPRDVMEGYLIMGEETAAQIETPPTHVFLQAGVGGLAGACAASARAHWGDDITIVVVEPDAAPALFESVKAGTNVETQGPVSTMGRLDCKTPSHLALKYLAKEADYFTTISDESVAQSLALFAANDIATSPSGGAGLSALHHCNPASLGIDETSHVLCYISEGI